MAIAAYHRTHAQNVSGKSPKIDIATTVPSDLSTAFTQCFDGLMHKQQALQHLKTALENPNNLCTLVPAVLLLIWIEILESGKPSWQCHIDGLRELIRKRKLLHHYEPATASDFFSLFESCEEHYLE